MSNAPADHDLVWFERIRRRCIDHFRALTSIQQAHKYAHKISRAWGYLDDDMASALHAASVVAYTRPFTNAETKTGNVQYPVRDLKREPGFDMSMHNHLLTIRNRLIAHSDYALLRSTMYLQSVGDNYQLPVTLGVNVKRLIGIEQRELAARYVNHCSSCVTRISRRFNDEFNMLARHVRDNPGHFRQTQTFPEEAQQLEAAATWRLLQPPGGPAGNVSEPEFAGDIAGYKYELIRHQKVLIKSGTYSVIDNGKEKSLTFEVDGPDIGDG